MQVTPGTTVDRSPVDFVGDNFVRLIATREIIGERIRDKIAAAKRKGKYTGILHSCLRHAPLLFAVVGQVGCAELL